jgi:hypothetical protein
MMKVKPANYIWTSRQTDRKSGFGLGSFAVCPHKGDSRAMQGNCVTLVHASRGDAVGSVQRPSCSCTGLPFRPWLEHVHKEQRDGGEPTGSKEASSPDHICSPYQNSVDVVLLNGRFRWLTNYCRKIRGGKILEDPWFLNGLLKHVTCNSAYIMTKGVGGMIKYLLIRHFPWLGLITYY